VAQIHGVNFMGAVVKLAQFGNAPLVDIKPGDGNPGSRKGSRYGQPDIAKPDDRDFTPVCHELVFPNFAGAARPTVPEIKPPSLAVVRQAPQ
jgi:hypothetical protein